jgi:valyl-tRNA synthetase
MPGATTNYGHSWYITSVFMTGVGFFMWPQNFGASYSAKSGDTLRRNAIVMPMYSITMPLMLFVGLTALMVIPGLSNGDLSMLTLVRKTFPPWFLGVIGGAGALTAMVPSAILILTAATLFAKNICRNLFAPNMTDRGVALLARVMVLVEGYRAFANKIWNAARFVIGQTAAMGGEVAALETLQPKTLADRWILSRAQRLAREVTRLMESYDFGEAGRQINEFFWSEYCDWYLEVAKAQLRDEATGERTAQLLRATLDHVLRLLHPFMPFVTEEIWQHLYADVPEAERPASALIVAPWPAPTEVSARQIDDSAEEDFELLQEIVTRIRDARKQAEVDPAKRVAVILAGGAKTAMLKRQAGLIEQLARTEEPQVERRLANKPEQAMALVADGVEVYLPLAGLLDIEKEQARLADEIAKAQALVERSRRVLDNPDFVVRAKPAVVQKERDALAAAEDTVARLEARRKELSA